MDGCSADVDLPKFAVILTMSQEVRDTNTYHQLQDDVVEHLWRLKAIA
jgi:hypothetical protein